MSSCLICLECNSDDAVSCIMTESTEWIEGNMQKVIEKHLWWWYFEPRSKECGQWICRNCWHEVSSFHNFYTKIEKAHSHYQRLLTSLKKESERTSDDEIMMCDFNDRDQYKLHISRRQPSGTQCKEATAKTKTIDEVLMVDIKTEVSCGPYECTDSFTQFNDIEIKSDQDYIGELKTDVSRDENCTDDKPLSKGKEKSVKKISKIDELIDHKLECHICNEHLKDFRELKEHYQNEHNTKGYAMCCGKRFSERSELIDHLRVHEDPNYFKCPLCMKNYPTRRGLAMHAAVHKPRERIYNCKECGKSFFKRNVYERHRMTHVPEHERKFKCSQCEKKFCTDSLRRKHEDCTHSKKYIKVCEICGKGFGSREKLRSHMEQHTGISAVSCDECGIIFANKSCLSRHIKMRHTAENLEEQICPYCSKVSPNINAHRMHIKFKHLMERKHSCHMCDRAFKRPLELKEHLSAHTGEPLYKCPHCTRKFFTSSNMYYHRKSMHYKEWEESRLKREGILPVIDTDETRALSGSTVMPS